MIPALTKGGAERVAVDLANSSARDGHSVTLIVGWKVDENFLRVRLVPAVRVTYMNKFSRGKLRRYLVSMCWILKNYRWLATQDVLHVHLTMAAVLGTLLYGLRALSKGIRPAIVESYHAVGMNIPGLERAFHSWSLHWRDGIALIALDPYWRNFLDRNPSLVCELIPNGVDAPVGALPAANVRAYLNEIGVPHRATHIIGTVGQFRADRQPLTIARILIDVLKQTPDDVHALMCGAGSELEPIRALIKAEGLSTRFTLPGLVNDPRLAMSAMSLYLTINVGDTTGIAALEAAFCGVPVVALQFDPSHKPVDGDWIWSSAVPDAISCRILALLAAPEERAYIAAQQQAQAIAEYSVERMHSRYIDLYRRAHEASQACTP
jgi:glycosyltransferase involved in cell wall biosynthesis